MTAVPISGKYHISLNGEGYIISPKRGGEKWYQKRVAPTFVNKFGSGDVSYRDSTYWQFWAITNWRNGGKQLQLDDPGKFWKSSDVDVSTLNEITLSKALTSVGALGSGITANCIAGWRISQTWWNNNYTYRRQISVTAPATKQLPQYYPVVVTVNTAVLEAASKVRSDRKDWRIVYWNGSANVDLFRDYSSTTTTAFPIQAAIPAGTSDSNYFIYYGYSAESTTKQPSSETEWNTAYGYFGNDLTSDSNSKGVYHFREGSGTTINDDSAGTNAGTGTSISWGTDSTMGRYASLNGSSSYISYGTGTDFDLGSMTLELFVNPGLASAGASQTLVAKWGNAGDRCFKLSMNGSNQLEFQVSSDGTATAYMGGSTVLSQNTWYHVAATYDGSSVAKLYLNNVVDATATLSSAVFDSGAALVMGRSNEGALYFQGKIAHARLSNTVKTSFAYGITDPSNSTGSETTSQPPSSSADVYAGGSDGKVYKFDGTSTWTEQYDTTTLTGYESGDDGDANVGNSGGTEEKRAQSIQFATATSLKTVKLYLRRASATQGATLRLETNSGSLPTATLVDTNATVSVTNGDIPVSNGWVTFTFPAEIALSATTTYWLVLQSSNIGSETDVFQWRIDTSSPSYSSGNYASKAGAGAWVANTSYDCLFKLYAGPTSVNDLLVTSVGGTLKMLIATGTISSQINGNARLYSFDGSNYSLEKTFGTATESQVMKLAEFNSKLYAGVGPQGRIYEGTSPSSWTLSKDIDVPNKPGYIYHLKEYNGKLYAGGGAPEFLYDKHYQGFWYVFDTNAWTSLYPFDFTEIRSFEFYDGYLFGGTYDGRIYVFDSSSLNPLFNFKELYGYNVTIMDAKLYDDKIYFFLYPQDGSNEANVGVWVFDRHGMSLAFSKTSITGFKCSAVVNNIMYVGTGTNGNIYKVDETKHATTGYVQSSYFDASLPSITKLFHSITLNHDPLNAGESVAVYYKFKESESWVLLGTSDTTSATSKTMSFPTGTTGKKMSLKLVFTTSNTSSTPKVSEVITQYKIQPIRKWAWTMRVLAKKQLTLLDKTEETRTATEIRTDLETAQELDQLISFTDIDGTDYTVVFDTIDQSSWVTNQSDVNENEILISLLES